MTGHARSSAIPAGTPTLMGKLSRSGVSGDQGERPCGTNDSSGEATDVVGSPDTATPPPPSLATVMLMAGDATKEDFPRASTFGRAELHVTQQLRYRTVTPGGQNLALRLRPADYPRPLARPRRAN